MEIQSDERRQRIAVYLEEEILQALDKFVLERCPQDRYLQRSSGAVRRALAIFLGVEGWSGCEGFGAAWGRQKPTSSVSIPKSRTADHGRLNTPGLRLISPEQPTPDDSSELAGVD